MTCIGLRLIIPAALLVALGAAFAMALSAQSITVSNFTSPLDLGTTEAGTAGTANSYTLDATGLTADVTVTAPAGVEVSQTDAGTGFSTSIMVAHTSGAVTSQTIWVRVSATATVGAISGDVTNESAGATTQNVPVVGTVEAPVVFVCHDDLGRGLGFWANKPGRTILAAHDPAWSAELGAHDLVNEDGSLFEVTAGDFETAHAEFRAWILGANARNMAYMLSAQMTALMLNLEFGPMSAYVDLHVEWNGTHVALADLISDANDLLISDPVAMAGSQARADQEELKDLFDAINNNEVEVCEPQSGSSSVLASDIGGDGGPDEAGCAAGAGAGPALLALLFGTLLRRRKQPA